MPYGTKPAGKPKPSNYPYGQTGGNEMINKSKEVNRGPGFRMGGRIKGFKKTIGKGGK